MKWLYILLEKRYGPLSSLITELEDKATNYRGEYLRVKKNFEIMCEISLEKQSQLMKKDKEIKELQNYLKEKLCENSSSTS